MSETLKELKKKFLPYKVPSELEELCKYWDKNPIFFAGSFEVNVDEYDAAKSWFQDIEEGYSKVKVFGTDGIQSLYAFWLNEGKTIDNAPIIYLGGEGEMEQRQWPAILKNFYRFLLPTAIMNLLIKIFVSRMKKVKMVIRNSRNGLKKNTTLLQ